MYSKQSLSALIYILCFSISVYFKKKNARATCTWACFSLISQSYLGSVYRKRSHLVVYGPKGGEKKGMCQ